MPGGGLIVGEAEARQHRRRSSTGSIVQHRSLLNLPAVFDEEFYLATNPDVADAVAIGLYSSGWQHFELFGRNEGRSPCRHYIFYIDVFSYCNLRCPSCLVGNRMMPAVEWRRGLMSPDLLMRILDKALEECGVSSVALYNWTEPLLHPNIIGLIRVAKERNLHCSISSNLNVLRDPEGLFVSGLDSLRISLSGFTQPVYERGHRGGNIETVKANMRRLADAKLATGAKTRIEVFYHCYRDNRDEIELMRALSNSLHFDFQMMDAYVTVVEKVLALVDGERGPQDAALLERLVVPLDKAVEVTSLIGSDRCALLEDMIVIDVTGNVMLCCGSSLTPTNIIGNFLDLRLVDIQRRRREHNLCSDCMKLGLPTYFTGHPEVAHLADDICISQKSV